MEDPVPQPMEFIIPPSAIQACLTTGSLVYIVLNSAGELTGLFVSKTALAVASVAGIATTFIAGAPTGFVTAEVIKNLSEGTYIPAIRTGSRLGALGIATGVGLVAGLVVTLAVHGSAFAVKAYRSLQRQDVHPIDYELIYEEDFTIVHLYAVLGNPPGDGKN
jgi:hypothetical protein